MNTLQTSLSRATALNDRVKAVLLMCAAVTMFSCLDTMAKHLMQHHGLPTAEIVWVRFLAQILLMAAVVGPLGVPALFRTKRLDLQVSRSMLMAVTTGLNFLAIGYLRLDQTISVTFLAPLIVALLAGPLLGEHVGWRRAAAIVVGFVGVLIVVRPGFADVHPAFAASFASMLGYALFMITTRKLSNVDPPMVTLFYAMLFGAVGGAAIALPVWVWPADFATWLKLASLGLFGGVGHYLLILAYRYAPASSVSPFLYFQILSMATLGYLVFGDRPDVWSLIGSAVIVASGVYLVHRERRAGLAPAPPAE